MRIFSPDWRVWLAASLFPLKIYTVVAALWLIVWHAGLPANKSYSWYNAVSDFSFFADCVRQGYFLVAFALVLGGLIQWFKCSRKAALWSMAFGVAAFVIGVILSPYCGLLDFGIE
jgi:hypothetical protein